MQKPCNIAKTVWQHVHCKLALNVLGHYACRHSNFAPTCLATCWKFLQTTQGLTAMTCHVWWMFQHKCSNSVLLSTRVFIEWVALLMLEPEQPPTCCYMMLLPGLFTVTSYSPRAWGRSWRSLRRHTRLCLSQAPLLNKIGFDMCEGYIPSMCMTHQW